MFEPNNVKGFGTKDLRKLSHILNEDQHVCKLQYIYSLLRSSFFIFLALA